MCVRRITSLLLPAVAGCSMPAQRADFDSVDPAERTLAIGEAARAGDRGATGDLIALLESDDPAERLAAIRALERITGETMGYDYAAGEPRRREAVERWVAWQRAGGRGERGEGVGEPRIN